MSDAKSGPEKRAVVGGLRFNVSAKVGLYYPDKDSFIAA